MLHLECEASQRVSTQRIEARRDEDELWGPCACGGFYAGQQVVLLWDGLSAHWSHDMRAWLEGQRDWLQVERLPGYAPELNPVEYLWANLKDLELANLPATTLAEVADATTQGIQRVCKSDNLVVGFLAHTGLTLDP